MDLNTFIKIKKIKKKDFAKMIGITPQSLTNYLTGKRIPHPIIAHKIIDFSKGSISLEDLYLPYHKRKNKD